MPMFRVIPIWIVALCIFMLAAGGFVGRATGGPSQAARSPFGLVPPDLSARRWPDGYHTYHCQGPRGALICEVDLVGPAGVQAGGYADWSIEVLRDRGVRVAHNDCGPVYEDRVARCAFNVQGEAFQGGLVTTTFTLSNGEQRSLSYNFGCTVSTPDGEECRRRN